MDTRIDPNALFGLVLGDAQILRNAGARVTPDVVRGLTLSSHRFGTDSVLLLHHSECGIFGTTDEELASVTGAAIEFLAFGDHRATLAADIAFLSAAASLRRIRRIAGAHLDVGTGAVEIFCRWEQSE